VTSPARGPYHNENSTAGHSKLPFGAVHAPLATQGQLSDLESGALEDNTPAASAEWYYLKEDEEFGPFTLDRMRNWVIKGALKGHLLVQKADELEWVKIEERFSKDFKMRNSVRNHVPANDGPRTSKEAARHGQTRSF
jgi:hypothetical protein